VVFTTTKQMTQSTGKGLVSLSVMVVMTTVLEWVE
jgi:hypothetical protein